jgi:hypothetical protein
MRSSTKTPESTTANDAAPTQESKGSRSAAGSTAGRPLSPFVGTWYGTSKNNLGSNRAVIFTITPLGPGSVRLQATYDGSPQQAIATVKDDEAVFKMDQGCNGKLTLVDRDTMTETCRWLMFSEKGSLQRSR